MAKKQESKPAAKAKPAQKAKPAKAAPAPAAKAKPAPEKPKPAEKAKPAAKAAPAPAAKPSPAPASKPATPATPAPAQAAAVASKPAGKAAPIPAGHHALTPHLIVRGAAHAIDFYKRAFGAVEQMRMPGADGFSIAHASVVIGDSHLYLCDESPNWGIKAPPTIGGTAVSVHLYVEDVDATFKQALEAGATQVMPLTDMFWGDRFGKVRDPFGHEWSIATHKEDMSLEEMGRRAEEAMKKMNRPEHEDDEEAE